MKILLDHLFFTVNHKRIRLLGISPSATDDFDLRNILVSADVSSLSFAIRVLRSPLMVRKDNIMTTGTDGDKQLTDYVSGSISEYHDCLRLRL